MENSPTSIYDLHYLPTRFFVSHAVQHCFKGVLDMCNEQGLRKSWPLVRGISKEKLALLFIDLMARHPDPMIDYIAGGALRRVKLHGNNKKHIWLEWAPYGDCYIDTTTKGKV